MKSEMKSVCIVLGILLFAGVASAQPKLMWYNSCNDDAELLKDGGTMSSGVARHILRGYSGNAYAGDSACTPSGIISW